MHVLVVLALQDHVKKCMNNAGLDDNNWEKHLGQKIKRASQDRGFPEIQLSCSVNKCCNPDCCCTLPTTPTYSTSGSCYVRNGGRLKAEVLVFKCMQCGSVHYPSFW